MAGDDDSARERVRRAAYFLFFAGEGDTWRLEQLLLEFGLDDVSDVKDYDGRTPLHLAAANGAYAASSWLLEHGAVINALDAFGRTPLEDAVRRSHTAVARLLVSKGGLVSEHVDVTTPGRLVPLTHSAVSAASPVGFALAAEAATGAPRASLSPEWEIPREQLQVLGLLGEGQFGVVHKARWRGTTVTVKMLKRDQVGAHSRVAMQDFVSELNVLATVHHPNCVQFLGACTESDGHARAPIIVQEYCPGFSLADVLEGTDPGVASWEDLSLRRMVEISLDVSRALAYLHGKWPHAVLHRDVKPSNVMFTAGGSILHAVELFGDHCPLRSQIALQYGTAKVADFGLARVLFGAKQHPTDIHPGGGDGYDSNLTAETGTWRYMAPEVMNYSPYGPPADVYSFGLTMLSLFTGAVPFDGVPPRVAANAAANGERPQWRRAGRMRSSVPSKVRHLIEQCWEHDPDARPTFLRIIELLESYEHTLVHVPPQTPPPAEGAEAYEPSRCSCTVA